MSDYLWWPATVFVYYVIYGYFSQINNLRGGEYTFWLWVYGAICPFWAIVSKISKSMVIDGIIYDCLIIVGGFLGLAFAGATKDFSAFNYLGLIIVAIGVLIIRA